MGIFPLILRSKSACLAVRRYSSLCSRDKLPPELRLFGRTSYAPRILGASTLGLTQAIALDLGSSHSLMRNSEADLSACSRYLYLQPGHRPRSPCRNPGLVGTIYHLDDLKMLNPRKGKTFYAASQSFKTTVLPSQSHCKCLVEYVQGCEAVLSASSHSQAPSTFPPSVLSSSCFPSHATRLSPSWMA